MTNYNSSAAAYAPAHGGYPGEVQDAENDTDEGSLS
jgi:hypothetical protein